MASEGPIDEHRLSNLQKRFPDVHVEEIRNALFRAHNHAGRAAGILIRSGHRDGYDDHMIFAPNPRESRIVKSRQRKRLVFTRHDGHILTGSEKHTQILTVEEAKDEVGALHDCAGFCFLAPETDQAVRIHFKSCFANPTSQHALGSIHSESFNLPANPSSQHALGSIQSESFHLPDLGAVFSCSSLGVHAEWEAFKISSESRRLHSLSFQEQQKIKFDTLMFHRDALRPSSQWISYTARLHEGIAPPLREAEGSGPMSLIYIEQGNPVVHRRVRGGLFIEEHCTVRSREAIFGPTAGACGMSFRACVDSLGGGNSALLGFASGSVCHLLDNPRQVVVDRLQWGTNGRGTSIWHNHGWTQGEEQHAWLDGDMVEFLVNADDVFEYRVNGQLQMQGSQKPVYPLYFLAWLSSTSAAMDDLQWVESRSDSDHITLGPVESGSGGGHLSSSAYSDFSRAAHSSAATDVRPEDSISNVGGQAVFDHSSSRSLTDVFLSSRSSSNSCISSVVSAGAREGKCFLEGTLLKDMSGRLVPVEQLKVFDTLCAANKQPIRVMSMIGHIGPHEIVSLVVDDIFLSVTASHRVVIKRGRELIAAPARSLRLGDDIACGRSVRKITQEPQLGSSPLAAFELGFDQDESIETFCSLPSDAVLTRGSRPRRRRKDRRRQSRIPEGDEGSVPRTHDSFE